MVAGRKQTGAARAKAEHLRADDLGTRDRQMANIRAASIENRGRKLRIELDAFGRGVVDHASSRRLVEGGSRKVRGRDESSGRRAFEQGAFPRLGGIEAEVIHPFAGRI